MNTSRRPMVGLTFSGGGFRATAFGLGALRALHDRKILGDVGVVSGISGGSLLTAMWAYGPKGFDEFDATVVAVLRRGLHLELVRRAFGPRRMAANVTNCVATFLTGPLKRNRTSTRTDALVEALSSRIFGSMTMSEVTHPGLSTIISATDLSTGNAVRFGNKVSSCSPHGYISEPVQVADAVAASAAFPALLPPLNRTYTFNRTDGSQHLKTMMMTDGGVYDNLGLSPLLPGRSAAFTSQVHEPNYLIAIDAGLGRAAVRAPNLILGRLKRSFEIAHTRSQDGSRARVHELAATGQIQGFVHAYLGMQDEHLPMPLPDLVERNRVSTYPTNFARMATDHLNAISTRGEQLTRALIDYYCPTLGR